MNEMNENQETSIVSINTISQPNLLFETGCRDRVPSLTLQSLNVCLDFWRKYFVNPSASCRMKWPGAFIISELISKVGSELSMRDISGMCLTMLEADDSLSVQNWLQIVYQIYPHFSTSSGYFQLVEKLCEKIPENESKSLENWITYFSTDKLSFEPNIFWVYALRNRLLKSNALGLMLSGLLSSSQSDKRVVELICLFKIDEFVNDLKEKLTSEVKIWKNRDTVFQQEYLNEHFNKWKLAVRSFPEIAEMVYHLSYPEFKACLFEIASPDSVDEVSQLYFKKIVNDPEIVAAAVSLNMSPNLLKDDQYLDLLFKNILRAQKLTPNMIKLAFHISPEKMLDQLYNPENSPHVCKFIKHHNIYILSGLIESLDSFTQDSIRRIISDHWTQLKDILAPDSFPQSRSIFRGLNGIINTNQDSRNIIDEHIRAVFTSEDDWRYDSVIHIIYNAYQKIQIERLSKLWTPFIEFMIKCCTVNVECFTQSGTPTCRSKIMISNIDVDLLSKLHPKIIKQTLNDVSFAANQRLSWKKMEKSFIEYYTSISKEAYTALEHYSDNLHQFGLRLEDLAVRKATEKFREMEKVFNRQASIKGIDYSREVKWNEILTNEGRYMGSDRYRLTVLVTCPEVMEHVSNLKSSNQIQHLREISYIFAGVDCNWMCQQFFVYSCPSVHLSVHKQNLLFENMSKCGFQLVLRDVKIESTDGFTEIKKFWYAVGVYNGYYYKPTDALIPESFMDDVQYIPLDKAYIKKIIPELTSNASNAKIGNALKGTLMICLMEARTPCENAQLSDSVVAKLKDYIKTIANTTPASLKDIKLVFKSILPNEEI